MAKFKVGDKVKILDGSKIENYTGGWSSASVNDSMPSHVGKTVTINSLVTIFGDGRVGYKMKEIPYTWDERGLKLVSETIVIYRNDNEVIALNKRTGKKGVARCNPSDEFNFEVGARIALSRLFNKFVVGDKVIGNEKAQKKYLFTEKGWVGKVLEVCESSDGGQSIKVKSIENDDKFWVEAECFDIYSPEKEKLYCNGYNGKVVCTNAGCPEFTKGKIYVITNGKIVDDDGDKRPVHRAITSIEGLCKVFNYGDFIEVVE